MTRINAECKDRQSLSSPSYPCPSVKSVVKTLYAVILSSMLHQQITQDIIGAAMAVLNELKPGLDEKLYENAMVLELLARGHTVQQQRQFQVFYSGQLIGMLVPDLIVDEIII